MLSPRGWKGKALNLGESQRERLKELVGEFRGLIEFHSASFKEIDDKARYWLTVTLPSFIALTGYLIEKASDVSSYLICAGYALSACLLVSTYLFSSTILSRRVESGILAPQSRTFSGSVHLLDSDEEWSALLIKQTEEVLRAIKNNEAQNARKSSRLRSAEISLFRGAPAAVTLAAGAAFAYTATSPLFRSATTGAATAVADRGPSAAAVWAGAAGVAIGLGTAAAVVAFDHFVTIRRNRKS